VTSDASAESAQRICVFGGTFDPIHNAHLQIATEASRVFHFDRVLFVPAANPPHKQASQMTPYEHRFRMVELACQGHPLFEPSRLEDSQGPSYSIDTIERLKPTLGPGGRLFFLIGSDAFNDIESWHRWQDLVHDVEFVIVSRPGAKFRVPPGSCVHRLEGIALPVSSTDIRERLARRELTPELPPAVRAYIDRHHLY
jgi:nicotinate-nucleotide adenylyltransferase